MNIRTLRSLVLLFALCVLAQPVTSAEIKVELQTKRTWEFKSVGVRFNNEFSGARLNGVEQADLREFTVTINPENRQIGRAVV